MHLQTREYLSQPDFQTMIQNLNRNPGSMNAYLADPRFQVCVLLAWPATLPWSHSRRHVLSAVS